MTRRHTGLQQYKQACQIASAHGMFVVDKGDTFILYRKTPLRPVCLGKVSSAEALFRKVSRCAISQEGAR